MSRRERAASRSAEELEIAYGGMSDDERRKAMNADKNARYRARVQADRGKVESLPVGATIDGVEVDGSRMRRSSLEMKQWREEKARLDSEREEDRRADQGAAERTLGLGGGLKARYGGYCQLCEERILEEETIVARRIDGERKWVHEECAEEEGSSRSGSSEKSILRARKKAREAAEAEAVDSGGVCDECFMVKAANGACSCIG